MHLSIDKEKVAAKIIFICLTLLLLTLIIERLLHVKVINIEFIDRNLYTVVTDKGPINLLPEDIIRIESSTYKTGFQGTVAEQNRIFTNKGFLIISTLDNYSTTGKQLINEIGQVSVPIWQRQDVQPTGINSYYYAIGTPPQFIPLVQFIIQFQYILLTVAGITLIVLIFPFHRTAAGSHTEASFADYPDQSPPKK